MADASTFLKEGSSYAEKAIQYDRQAHEEGQTNHLQLFELAKESYVKAIEYYMTGLKYEKNKTVQKTLRQKINNYMDRAEVMKNEISIVKNNSNNSAQSQAENYLQEGLNHSKIAIELDKQACQSTDPQLFEQTKKAYLTAAQYYLTALKYQNNEQIKSTIREKITINMDRAEIMKEWLTKYREQEKKDDASSSSRGTSSSKPFGWFKKNKGQS